jgi:hypothetical protein
MSSSADEIGNGGWSEKNKRITILLFFILSVIIALCLFNGPREVHPRQHSLDNFHKLETDLLKISKKKGISEAERARIQEAMKKVEEARKLVSWNDKGDKSN